MIGMRYDLVLKGGHLIDPVSGIDERRDVAFSAGRVAAVDTDIPREAAREAVDISGAYVVPGLVDLHVHAFIHGYDVGIQLDGICSSTGVTTVCDGGSTGAVNFTGLREYVMARAETRVLAYLNISAIGMTVALGIGEYRLIDYSDPDLTAGVVGDNRDVILGIKVREQIELVGEHGLEPLQRALRAAEAAGTPVMLHLENPPAEYGEVLALLRPGDIVSHVFNGHGSGILDESGRIKRAVHEARRRGILFEVAYGQFHCNFNVVRKAFEERFGSVSR